MIPLDNSQRAALFQERAELFERTPWFCKMFQHETDKDVIETFRFEREPKDVLLPECHARDPFLTDRFFRPLQGLR